MIALYIYSQTSFKSDTQIETMFGALMGAGVVTLQPGAYRTAPNAEITPSAGSDPSGYQVVTHEVVVVDGRKTIVPDPPQLAAQQLGMTDQQLKGFLMAGGDATQI